MATVLSTLVPTPRSRIQLRSWVLTATDDGGWVEMSALQDRTVHLFGTWGGGTISIEGSNEAAPVAGAGNSIILRDPAGNALTFTANGLKAILELPRWIRPRATSGVTSVTILINGRGDTR